MVAKSDKQPVGNKTICLRNLILGPHLYDVIAQCCSTGLFLNKCVDRKMGGQWATTQCLLSSCSSPCLISCRSFKLWTADRISFCFLKIYLAFQLLSAFWCE